MIIEGLNIEKHNLLSADVCIVGAGVAGLTMAKEFSNQNRKIILLESGELEPGSKVQSLNNWTDIGLPLGYETETARVRALGGTSHRWFIDIGEKIDGVCLRGLDKIDFEKRDWVPHSGWPINKDELDPYYDRAHELLKLGPYNYSVDYWESQDKKSHFKLNDEVINSTIFQFARKDIFYNACYDEIKKASNIQTILNATVLTIQTTSNASKVKSVLATNLNGDKFAVKAKYFVLALGCLQTTRLLLLSNEIVKEGLGNQNDLVGRFFMEHPHLQSGVFIPSNFDTFGIADLYKIHSKNNIPIRGSLKLNEYIMKKERLLNFTASIHYSPLGKMYQVIKYLNYVKNDLSKLKLNRETITYATHVLSNIDSLIYAAAKKIANRQISVNNYIQEENYHAFALDIMSEQTPNPDSRVLLDTECDFLGQNKIKLNWQLNSNDIRSIRRSQEIINLQLRKTNIGHLEFCLKNDKVPRNMKGGWHHMGTTRMHTNPKKGVVDNNCKIHGIQNLYIASSSVFPTGGYANPTLTIVALAIRLADHLRNI